MPKTAAALRLVRVVGDGFRNFEAITFPRNPYAGCELYVRRAAVAGVYRDDIDSDCLIDVLDAEGDLIETFFASRNAFKYLRTKLACRVEISEKERG
jgi:hypothetical protein